MLKCVINIPSYIYLIFYTYEDISHYDNSLDKMGRNMTYDF